MKPSQLHAIVKHGEDLNRIFNTGLYPLDLCNRLRRLEKKAERIAVDYCNGEGGYTEDNIDSYVNTILNTVNKLLGNENKSIPIFINLDPRGYALKIMDSFVRDNNLQILTDMGGDGLIAPEIN